MRHFASFVHTMVPRGAAPEINGHYTTCILTTITTIVLETAAVAGRENPGMDKHQKGKAMLYSSTIDYFW